MAVRRRQRLPPATRTFLMTQVSCPSRALTNAQGHRIDASPDHLQCRDQGRRGHAGGCVQSETLRRESVRSCPKSAPALQFALRFLGALPSPCPQRARRNWRAFQPSWTPIPIAGRDPCRHPRCRILVRRMRPRGRRGGRHAIILGLNLDRADAAFDPPIGVPQASST